MLAYEGDFSMITIGCDIGKSNIDVFLGGKHYKFKNEKEGIEKFLSKCDVHKISRIVLEPTGGYELKHQRFSLDYCRN